LVHESPRLRRVCLVCSYERGGLAAGVVSVWGVRVGDGVLWAAPAMSVAAARSKRRFPPTKVARLLPA